MVGDDIVAHHHHRHCHCHEKSCIPLSAVADSPHHRCIHVHSLAMGVTLYVVLFALRADLVYAATKSTTRFVEDDVEECPSLRVHRRNRWNRKRLSCLVCNDCARMGGWMRRGLISS